MNTRKYPRSLAEAFGPYTDSQLHPIPERSRISKHVEFVVVFFLYWKAHRAAYAFRIARGIAYRNMPF